MTYTHWRTEHQKKHDNILAKLKEKNYTKEEIIEYFDFENMVNEEADFCLLYQEKKKCHNMESLNCFHCACPHFVFKEEGLYEKDGFTIFSECSISHGGQFTHEKNIHQDCTNCLIPHKKAYVTKSLKNEDI